jgi:hypothetical protein
MVAINPTVMASDNCDPSLNIELISITSNEGDRVNTYESDYDLNLGDGNTSNDILVDATGKIYLRAERSGTGSGRIYTITYKATDTAGNYDSVSATVTVPHNQ